MDSPVYGRGGAKATSSGPSPPMTTIDGSPSSTIVVGPNKEATCDDNSGDTLNEDPMDVVLDTRQIVAPAKHGGDTTSGVYTRRQAEESAAAAAAAAAPTGSKEMASSSLLEDSVTEAVAAVRSAVVASAVSAIGALVAASTTARTPHHGAALPSASSTAIRFSEDSSTARRALPTAFTWKQSESSEPRPPSAKQSSASLLFPGPSPWPTEGAHDDMGEDLREVEREKVHTSKTTKSISAEEVDATAGVGGKSGHVHQGKGIASGTAASNGKGGMKGDIKAREGKAKASGVGVQRSRGGGALGHRPSWRPCCENIRCNKSPCFGFPGMKGQFCVKHKADGMINVRRAKCQVQGCTKSPSQGLARGQKARFCKDHRLPGMFNVSGSSECRHPSGCSRLATHAPPRAGVANGAAAVANALNGDDSGKRASESVPSRRENGSIVDGSGNDGTPNEGAGDDRPGAPQSASRTSGAHGDLSSSVPNVATASRPASAGGIDAKGVAGDAGGVVAGAGARNGVRADQPRPTRCWEHAGSGWVDVVGDEAGGGFGDRGDSDTAGFQRTKRRRRSTRTAADARDGQYSGDRRSPGDVDHKYDHTGRQHDMDARKPDVDGRFKSRSGLGGFGQSVVGGSSSQSLYMDGSFGDGDGGGQNPGEVFTGGRWSGKMKGVNDQCPHPKSKHYCHGKCKLCYMKEYNQKTRLASGKPAEGRRGRKAAGGADGVNDSTSPRGSGEAGGTANATSLGGLRKRRRTDVKGETLQSADHADKGWRKIVTSCAHADAPHYGKGFCRPCYMREYNRAKRRGEPVMRLPGSVRPCPPSLTSATGGPPGAGSSATSPTGDAHARSSNAMPKTMALPPPICADCGQTEKCWAAVLICDGCESTSHLGCKGRSDQPLGEWFCSRCTAILLDSDSDPDDALPSSTKARSAMSSATEGPAEAAGSTAAAAAEAARIFPKTGAAAAAGASQLVAPPARPASNDRSGRPARVATAVPDALQRPASTVDTQEESDANASPNATAGDSGDIGAVAVGWQTPRPATPIATTILSSTAAGPSAPGRAGYGGGNSSSSNNSSKGVVATASNTKGWPLKGDVRGCRCPDCVSILLQSGGKRPPEASKLILTTYARPASALSTTSNAASSGGAGGAGNGNVTTGGVGVKRRRRRRPTAASADHAGNAGQRNVNETISAPRRPSGMEDNRARIPGAVGRPRGSRNASIVKVETGGVHGANGGTGLHRVALPVRREVGAALPVAEVAPENVHSVQGAEGGGNAATAGASDPAGDGRVGARTTRSRWGTRRHRQDEWSSGWASDSSGGSGGGGDALVDVGGNVEGEETTVPFGGLGGPRRRRRGGDFSDDSYSMSSGRSSSSGDEGGGGGTGRRGGRRRGRGRGAASVGSSAPGSGVARRRPGRPRKFPLAAVSVGAGVAGEEASVTPGTGASHGDGGSFPLGVSEEGEAGPGEKAQVAPGARKRGSPKASRKGVVTECPHTDRELYSRGQCKRCYMVTYWDRKHAELGIKRRNFLGRGADAGHDIAGHGDQDYRPDLDSPSLSASGGLSDGPDNRDAAAAMMVDTDGSALRRSAAAGAGPGPIPSSNSARADVEADAKESAGPRKPGVRGDSAGVNGGGLSERDMFRDVGRDESDRNPATSVTKKLPLSAGTGGSAINEGEVIRPSTVRGGSGDEDRAAVAATSVAASVLASAPEGKDVKEEAAASAVREESTVPNPVPPSPRVRNERDASHPARALAEASTTPATAAAASGPASQAKAGVAVVPPAARENGDPAGPLVAEEGAAKVGAAEKVPPKNAGAGARSREALTKSEAASPATVAAPAAATRGQLAPTPSAAESAQVTLTMPSEEASLSPLPPLPPPAGATKTALFSGLSESPLPLSESEPASRTKTAAKVASVASSSVSTASTPNEIPEPAGKGKKSADLGARKPARGENGYAVIGSAVARSEKSNVAGAPDVAEARLSAGNMPAAGPTGPAVGAAADKVEERAEKQA